MNNCNFSELAQQFYENSSVNETDNRFSNSNFFLIEQSNPRLNPQIQVDEADDSLENAMTKNQQNIQQNIQQNLLCPFPPYNVNANYAQTSEVDNETISLSASPHPQHYVPNTNDYFAHGSQPSHGLRKHKNVTDACQNCKTSHQRCETEQIELESVIRFHIKFNGNPTDFTIKFSGCPTDFTIKFNGYPKDFAIQFNGY
ncbi:8304_t:CDS:2 [Racocetra fulgida]|uniref:8304_t:CDS:1 n=1 Tax=Racocetra fulgida TaxID=60492 RepID=A0A9N8ZVC2_9GLOM|nr:8304_t:CDS:2 [Racocetra fulgida]